MNTPEPLLWLETPAPRAKDLDETVAALRVWNTRTAIVTTWDAYVTNLYNGIRGRMPPGMQIQGGFKTSRRLPTFSDPRGWEQIAEVAEQVATLTNMTHILLDNEDALEKYHQGEATINYDELARSLEVLAATDLTFWWYQPEIMDDDERFPGRPGQTARLVETVANAVPRSMFSMGYRAYHDWDLNERDVVARRNAMIEFVGEDRVQDRLIVTSTGRADGRSFGTRCHTPDEAYELSRRLLAPVIYYPGRPTSNWMATGHAYAKVALRRLREGG